MIRHALATLAMLSVLAACRTREGSAAEAHGEEQQSRLDRLAQRMARPDTVRKDTPLAKWILPASLGEVSGLALTGDGRLLAHDDELGRVTVIEPRSGTMVKQFMLGDRNTLDDFEGITIADGLIFMVTSNGRLYEFRESADGERVRYVMHDTQLGRECEFEGVVYDARLGALVMPCKIVRMQGLRNHLVIYRWHLRGEASPRLARFTIPMRSVSDGQKWKTLHASDITIDPGTGNYVLISALEQALVEISAAGEVRRVQALPGAHPRAEGVAITPDGILIISDEGGRASASLTLYRWPLPAAEEDVLP